MTTASYTAWLFHETYERLAPDFGYEVRPDVGQRPFSELPDNNRALMIATAQEVIDALAVEEHRELAEHVGRLLERLGCRHAFDPECARCELTVAVRLAHARVERATTRAVP
jgi:hypothetical protein